MAVQHHVAFSSSVDGVGVLAGGPFWCAQSKLPIALTSCTVDPSLIDISELVGITYSTALTGFIDNPTNLVDDAAWLFSGLKDTVVKTGVVQKLFDYYAALGLKNTVMVNHIEAEHAMVTNDFGNSCGYKGEPFINNCGYDAAGSLLLHIYNHTTPLRPPTVASNLTNIIEFDQPSFNFGGRNWSRAGLALKGYAYVPTACPDARRRLLHPSSELNMPEPLSCRLHVAYHGCLQDLEDINSTFVYHAGYNDWAEANDLVILYPQVLPSLVNPKGCWDWWGYTGPEYASNIGAQLSIIRGMIRYLLTGVHN